MGNLVFRYEKPRCATESLTIDGARERMARTNRVHVANVGWVDVLRENEYNMEHGMPMESITKHRKSTAVREKGAKFEHDDYCFYCADGGELLCCTWCDHIHPTLRCRLPQAHIGSC